MKFLFSIFLVLVHLTPMAQAKDYAGTYGKRSESASTQTLLEYSLALKLDGTFQVHIYRNLDPTQPEENWFGKGTWTQEGSHTIIFHTNEQTDLDETFTMNLSNTKARSNRKSSRNTSTKVVQESIRFFQSDILWFKGLTLLKVD
jgi:hypothetical protein